jgi:hypothetical protein
MLSNLENIGIIDSTTRLHLVGSYYEIFVGLTFSQLRLSGTRSVQVLFTVHMSFLVSSFRNWKLKLEQLFICTISAVFFSRISNWAFFALFSTSLTFYSISRHFTASTCMTRGARA